MVKNVNKINKEVINSTTKSSEKENKIILKDEELKIFQELQKIISQTRILKIIAKIRLIFYQEIIITDQ